VHLCEPAPSNSSLMGNMRMVPGGPRESFYGSAHCRSRVDVDTEKIIGCSLEAGLIEWRLKGMLFDCADAKTESMAA
jgi:hypothetical protein